MLKADWSKAKIESVNCNETRETTQKELTLSPLTFWQDVFSFSIFSRIFERKERNKKKMYGKIGYCRVRDKAWHKIGQF